VVAMKRLPLVLLLIPFISACQAQPVTTPSVSTSATSAVATSIRASVNQGTRTPAPPSVIASAIQPTVHSRSSDPNALNLIIVRDQPIVNNSLTIESISAAQPGWIVIYFDQRGTVGPRIVYRPVPAGRSSHIIVSFSHDFNPVVNPAHIPGRQLHAVLQAGSPAPGSPALEKGHIVWVLFTVKPTFNP
jgi:hypothetical protein